MRQLLAALALTAVAAPAWAGDIAIDHEVLHYDVAGTTAGEILHDLERQARSAGRQYFADARWHVTWKYQYERPTRDSCRIGTLHVQLVQRAVLPRWRAATAPPALAARWHAFLAAVRQHEDGHLAHGARAADEVRDTLRGMHDDDCDRLGAKANAAGHAIIERYAARDARYDADTDHGIRQGAYWTGDDRGSGR